MKKILLLISSFLSISLCQAQWAPLNSTTSATLRDVDFSDEYYGVIVGDGNTILLTTDGGVSWNDINHHSISGDVYNVKVLHTDTVFVSTYDYNSAITAIYMTENTGATWSLVATDSTTNHRADLETNAPANRLFVSGSNLISSGDYGSSWDTLLNYVAGTTSTELLHFADSQTGHLSGNISGFIGYSAYFFRTADGGHRWYAGDPFSFPNSDALTTMCFVNADTSYAFMNQYAGWAPSATNRLVRMYNFNMVASPGDTTFTFGSAIVNNAMPDYMNDARFEDARNGLALGNAGKIYRTVNGGSVWTVDYADTCSTCAILKMDFENGVGYAVGENGMLVKYDMATGINNVSNVGPSLSVYPNPGTGVFMIRSGGTAKAILEVYTATGEKILGTTATNEYRLDLSGYAKGMYFAKLSINGKQTVKKIILE
jgi:photosystem II stability/assembly factor-like uncharacterized protein